MSGWTVRLDATDSFAILYSDLSTADVDGLGAALAAKINLSSTVHAEYLAASDKLVIVREGSTAFTPTLTENHVASTTLSLPTSGSASSVAFIVTAFSGTPGVTTSWTITIPNSPSDSTFSVALYEDVNGVTVDTLDEFGTAIAYKINNPVVAAFSAGYAAGSDTLTVTKSSGNFSNGNPVVLKENLGADRGRCTDCGACERSCPVGINMRLLTKKLEKDCFDLFGWEAGMSLEVRPPLDTYKPSDPNDFIK